MQIWQIAIMFSAAFLAGVVNSLAGGGTLLTFPALIWIGLDAKVANVTSTVALLPGALSSFVGYRREVRGVRHWFRLFILPSLIGGLLGALLLLWTPASLFAAIVPFLVLFATALFALQEPINKRLRRSRLVAGGERKAITPEETDQTTGSKEPETLRHADGSWNRWLVMATALQFVVAVYGGYFGAGIGILMLATFGLIGLTDIHQMNGLKNALGFGINGIAAASFLFSGQVHWRSALVMAVAAIVGGYSGANFARRMGRAFVRRAVIVIGLAMAISLFFSE